MQIALFLHNTVLSATSMSRKIIFPCRGDVTCHCKADVRLDWSAGNKFNSHRHYLNRSQAGSGGYWLIITSPKANNQHRSLWKWKQDQNKRITTLPSSKRIPGACGSSLTSREDAFKHSTGKGSQLFPVQGRASSRLTLNTSSTCLSLPSIGISGLGCNTQHKVAVSLVKGILWGTQNKAH